MAKPLHGIRVLDFSTLLPGPLATLLLAEAGAEVTRIERPDGGDDLRGYPPQIAGTGLAFALLHRGKRALALDLKDPAARARLEPLIDTADVLVEQFRPGVMARLGLDWPSLRVRNPKLVYCSITGYGQAGPKAGLAGHDLNYVADAGLLALAAGPDGAPVVPPGLIADIGGGAWPAAINILLALRQATATGEGAHLDVAMTDGLFAWQVFALAGLAGGAGPPAPGGELLTGGSPRYQLYRTRDGRYLALAALEERFWQAFCVVIELPARLRDDRADPAATLRAVAGLIESADATHWQAAFAGQDVCCCVVRSIEEALQDPHFQGRGLFEGRIALGDAEIPALPLPLAPVFRAAGSRPCPPLGAAPAP